MGLIDTLRQGLLTQKINQKLPEQKHEADPVPLPKEVFNSPMLKDSQAYAVYDPATGSVHYKGAQAEFANPKSDMSMARMHEWRHWRQQNENVKDKYKTFDSGSGYIPYNEDKNIFKSNYYNQPIEKDARNTEKLYAETIKGYKPGRK